MTENEEFKPAAIPFLEIVEKWDGSERTRNRLKTILIIALRRKALRFYVRDESRKLRPLPVADFESWPLKDRLVRNETSKRRLVPIGAERPRWEKCCIGDAIAPHAPWEKYQTEIDYSDRVYEKKPSLKERFERLEILGSDLEQWCISNGEPQPQFWRKDRVPSSLPAGSKQGLGTIAYKTGLPGRPSSWRLIEIECRRRFEKGEEHSTNIAWAQTLRSWFKDEHPEGALPAVKTLANKLAPLLRNLRFAKTK